MIKKKKLYRTVIQIEILSEEPISKEMSIEDIEEQCNTGSFSGVHDYKIINEKVVGKKALNLVLKQGTSPDFFQMDKNGNEINY